MSNPDSPMNHDHFLLSQELADIVSRGEFDFFIVDLEDDAGGIRESLHCFRAIEAAGCSTVLRVADISQAWAKKALDLGPDGITFPMVGTGRSASKVVSYCSIVPTVFADKLTPL